MAEIVVKVIGRRRHPVDVVSRPRALCQSRLGRCSSEMTMSVAFDARQ